MAWRIANFHKSVLGYYKGRRFLSREGFNAVDVHIMIDLIQTFKLCRYRWWWSVNCSHVIRMVMLGTCFIIIPPPPRVCLHHLRLRPLSLFFQHVCDFICGKHFLLHQRHKMNVVHCWEEFQWRWAQLESSSIIHYIHNIYSKDTHVHTWAYTFRIHRHFPKEAQKDPLHIGILEPTTVNSGSSHNPEQ